MLILYVVWYGMVWCMVWYGVVWGWGMVWGWGWGGKYFVPADFDEISPNYFEAYSHGFLSGLNPATDFFVHKYYNSRFE
jgi:hypothetical protein